MKVSLITVAVLCLFANSTPAGQLAEALKQVRKAHPEVYLGPKFKTPSKDAVTYFKSIGKSKYRVTKSKEVRENNQKWRLEVEPVLRKEDTASGYGQDLVIRNGPETISFASLPRMYTLPVPEGAEVMEIIFDRPFVFLYTFKNNKMKMHTYDLTHGSLLAEKNRRTVPIAEVQAKEMGLLVEAKDVDDQVYHLSESVRGMKVEASSANASK